MQRGRGQEVTKGTTMHFAKRDVVATCLVAAAGVFYLLWAIGSAPPGLSGVRATGLVVLALGFAASASAVVPTFEQLVHGSKVYVVGTSLIGLAALAGGLVMLVATSETGLAVVMAAMGGLWLIATIHHSLPAEPSPPGTSPPARGPAGRRARPLGAR